jgi:peptidoglycan/LPS O-acetylase OafA/YrhL
MLFIFKDFKFPRILVLLGGASYSLYLTHPYVIQVFEKLTSWFNEGLIKSTIALLLSLIITNGVALIVYSFLEEPTRKFLRMKLLTAG